ncbi:hypothetical protein I6N96_13475 [Enterococcus sp. BWM-S5]|uniref:CDI immunity protein domain-containing protein n=1 Tax=Enterococcus larvae TaxID=2794352 RepID=A0ABS4CM78_9ENTE|nr:hypothetical protein [Enterococcus larvae]MBP1047288.1 hypothetical protein [Enterococcus larvae]
MYTLVTDNQEKEELMKGYFILIRGHMNKAIENFIRKEGFGIEFMTILFKNDLDEFEDKEELQEIEENQVVLLAEYPAAPIDEKFYLTFDELYNNIERVVHKNYENDLKLRESLLELKKSLIA